MTQLETVKQYYLDRGLTCSEAVLYAANDLWNLGLDEKSFHLIGGFCGGMQCGSVCGAISGGIAAISARYLQTDAHGCPELKEHVTRFLDRVRQEMGTDMCCDLKPKYFNDTSLCFGVVEPIFRILLECEDNAQ